MWSCYKQTLNGKDRMNNYMEAAHKHLQTELQIDHPNIWKLIDRIKHIQKRSDVFY